MGLSSLSKRDISIHALVKRATQRKNSKQQHTKYFNPRPREEGDLPKKLKGLKS